MKIPHASRIEELRAEAKAERIRLLNEGNERNKDKMFRISAEKFTEDYVATEITNAIENDQHRVIFQLVKYDRHLESGGAKTEYVPFPSNIIALIKEAGYRYTHSYVSEFAVFFTKESEDLYYKYDQSIHMKLG